MQPAARSRASSTRSSSSPGSSEFIDTPVKRYSSGMYVRLAFAVAAHLEPEILLVDEVLAVGDAEFQRRCLGRMEDLGAVGPHGRLRLAQHAGDRAALRPRDAARAGPGRRRRPERARSSRATSRRTRARRRAASGRTSRRRPATTSSGCARVRVVARGRRRSPRRVDVRRPVGIEIGFTVLRTPGEPIVPEDQARRRPGAGRVQRDRHRAALARAAGARRLRRDRLDPRQPAQRGAHHRRGDASSSSRRAELQPPRRRARRGLVPRAGPGRGRLVARRSTWPAGRAPSGRCSSGRSRSGSPPSVFVLYRDSPLRRASLAAPSRVGASATGSSAPTSSPARGFAVRHSLEPELAPPRVGTGVLDRVLRGAVRAGGGYEGDFATVLASRARARTRPTSSSRPSTRSGSRSRCSPGRVLVRAPLRVREHRPARPASRSCGTRARGASTSARSRRAAVDRRLRPRRGARSCARGSRLAAHAGALRAVRRRHRVLPPADVERRRRRRLASAPIPQRDYALLAPWPPRDAGALVLGRRLAGAGAGARRASANVDRRGRACRSPRCGSALARARVVALPVRDNLYSGATTTLLQAMATAKPVVVSRTAAIAEGYGLEDGVNCRLVPPGDEAAFATALARAARGRRAARRRSAAARARPSSASSAGSATSTRIADGAARRPLVD